ncbi:GAF and ANTAR domain-containing protein [Blastococcus litoris]|uniref:GAF and ANTAR domain-containing protein n=1 Tax=Blastococcus litoris TaxID=2171622 RepID=UPI000E305462|nr:GAF and ANTAR domain-containing protein [Blastococcus litoris]
MSDSRRSTTTHRALEQLGALALRDHSMDSLLRRVVELTTMVMPRPTESSVFLVLDGRPEAVVSSGPLALEADEVQFGHGEGPCLHAAGSGEVTEVPDTLSETRWRNYMGRVVELGVRSSLSVPLPVSEGSIGALNIYAREPRAFDEEARAAAMHFVPYAAIAVGNMQAYADARSTAENLQAALASRAVIDQAKGILMERFRLTADKAFQVLAQTSMKQNIKVRVVAEELVRTGELPGTLRC